MKLLISIMLLLLFMGLAESLQVGGTTEKVLTLGSISRTAFVQENVSNETNVTNQTNATQGSGVIDIKNPMSVIPVTNKIKSTTMPNSIQANSIAYRFTT
ncbi:MAG: hypothetical protein PHF94_02275 [Methanothrix sp.]|nr:hypothetical protein [Methanothrix sp.]